MQRDLRRLADTPFDLLVVGGGIYGATAAWDATLRGLSVAIIDRGDFGGGTSFNSAKTVHGGVRELPRGNIAALRRFVRERRALSRIVPHLVHPLPFVAPTYRSFSRHREVLRLGFALYDLLAADRNALPDPATHLPRSRLLSRAECLAVNPYIDPAGVTGGVQWFDGQMYNSDRVTLSFVLSAVARGAVAANYVECVGGRRTADGIDGILVRDRLNDNRFDVRARVVLNGAGPWAPAVLTTLAPALADRLPRRRSKAMNVIVSRTPPGPHALAGPAGRRLVFLLPWRGVMLAGTSHDPCDEAPDALSVGRAEVERFLGDLNDAFPNLRLVPDDVRLVHRGLLPATDGGGLALLKRSIVRDHRADGVAGLLSVLGVRYTTARETARHAIDLVHAMLDRRPPPCRTADTPLIGGQIPSLDHHLRAAEQADVPGLDADGRRRIALTYGTTQHAVLSTFRRLPADRAPLGTACRVTGAEVRHAVRHEMAVRLSDAIMRRTEAGSAGHPGADALQRAADLMADELGWTRRRRDAEVTETDRWYDF